MSFRTIDLDEYKKLLKNKKKMFDMTFPTPESLNKYRDKNFMNLFGFSSSLIREGYNRSDLIPNVDKVKFLKLYCNLVDNREDNEFLTNVFIKGGISDQVTYENDNIYKSKNILNSTFNYIEICMKDQNNRPFNMKDFFQISVYIS